MRRVSVETEEFGLAWKYDFTLPDGSPLVVPVGWVPRWNASACSWFAPAPSLGLWGVEATDDRSTLRLNPDGWSIVRLNGRAVPGVAKVRFPTLEVALAAALFIEA